MHVKKIVAKLRPASKKVNRQHFWNIVDCILTEYWGNESTFQNKRKKKRNVYLVWDNRRHKHGHNCMSFIIRSNLWNWESGSVNKTFAAQARASEFRVREPTEKTDAGSCICNLSISVEKWEVDTLGSQEVHRPASLAHSNQSRVSSNCGSWKETIKIVFFWPPHVHPWH